MAVPAVIGEAFTFSALFLDENNGPIAVTAPKITVFRFSSAGAKNVLVDDADMDEATPAEVGRYTYTYTVPTTLPEGTALYAEIDATDPGDGSKLIAEQVVHVITRPAGGIFARLVE